MICFDEMKKLQFTKYEHIHIQISFPRPRPRPPSSSSRWGECAEIRMHYILTRIPSKHYQLGLVWLLKAGTRKCLMIIMVSWWWYSGTLLTCKSTPYFLPADWDERCNRYKNIIIICTITKCHYQQTPSSPRPSKLFELGSVLSQPHQV